MASLALRVRAVVQDTVMIKGIKFPAGDQVSSCVAAALSAVGGSSAGSSAEQYLFWVPPGGRFGERGMWLSGTAELGAFGLGEQDLVYLTSRQQVLRFCYESTVRTVLVDMLQEPRHVYPILEKKFSLSGMGTAYVLYAASRKAELVDAKSWLAQGVGVDESVDLVERSGPRRAKKLSTKERLTFSIYNTADSSALQRVDSGSLGTIRARPHGGSTSSSSSGSSSSANSSSHASSSSGSGHASLASSASGLVGLGGDSGEESGDELSGMSVRVALANAEKSGWVWKQNKRKKVEKRFAVLRRAGTLLYYKSRTDSKPAGAFDTQHYALPPLPSDPSRQPYVLELTLRPGMEASSLGLKHSTFPLRFDTYDECKQWHAALTNVRNRMQQRRGGASSVRKPPSASLAARRGTDSLLSNAQADLLQAHDSASSAKKGERGKDGSEQEKDKEWSGRERMRALGTPSSAKAVADVFGKPLTKAVQTADGTEIPYLIHHCIEYVDREALKTTGIYRLSGSAVVIEGYKRRVDQGETVDLRDEGDPHAVAGLLKLYFRQMPEPLLLSQFYGQWISSMAIRDRGLQLRYMRHLIDKLPPLHFVVLRYLLQHLQRVNEHSEVNKMALHNLATVFAPNLLARKGANMMEMVEDTPVINAIVHTLVADYAYLFENRPVEEVYKDPKAATRAPLCRALYEYAPQSPDEELVLVPGCIVSVLRDNDAGGWWFGELKGVFGRFPGSYVEPLTEQQMRGYYSKQKFIQEVAEVRAERDSARAEMDALKAKRDALLRDEEALGASIGAAKVELDIVLAALAPLCGHKPLPPRSEMSAIFARYQKSCRHHENQLKSVDSVKEVLLSTLMSVLPAVAGPKNERLRALIESCKTHLQLEELGRARVLDVKTLLLADVDDLASLLSSIKD